MASAILLAIHILVAQPVHPGESYSVVVGSSAIRTKKTAEELQQSVETFVTDTFDAAQPLTNGSHATILIPLGPVEEIRLTSAHDGVAFDIRASGHAEQLAWTAIGENTALLAYDKNANGSIDDGSELFGDQTVAGVQDGFDALRQLSGERTPYLTATNPLFPKLLLWVDRNHNGISEPEELLRFGDYFASIGLGAERIDRKDQYGNAFHLQGHAQRRTAPGPNITWDRAERANRNVLVYDVHLIVEK